MPPVLQSALAEAIDAVVGTFGPFVIPVALFVLGVVGYGCLLALQRLLGRR
jgi:hypothetical protein